MDEKELVRIAKALADPTRAAIVRWLREKPECTCTELGARFDIRQSTFSHHVKTLVDAEVVITRRNGQFHILTLNEDKLRAFARAVGPVRSR